MARYTDGDYRTDVWDMYVASPECKLPLVLTETGYGNVLALPLAPGLNNLYPTSKSGHRFKSAAYKRWEVKANEWLVRQAPLWVPEMYEPKPNTPWALDAYVFMPTLAGDLDGRLKAPIDFLCARTGLEDKCLQVLKARRITDKVRRQGLVLVLRTM